MNDIHKLREELFHQLDKLKESEGKTTEEQHLAIDKANAMTGVCKTILDSVKVEHAFMKMMERRAPLSQFIPLEYEGSIFTIEHATRMAAIRRSEWKANNPDKIQELKQLKQG